MAGITDAKITDLETLMADRSSAYWQGPEAKMHQDEYRALIARRDDLPDAGASSEPSSEAREIARTEVLMQDRKSRYWQGPASEGIRARYQTLIAQRDGLPVAPKVGRRDGAVLSSEAADGDAEPTGDPVAGADDADDAAVAYWQTPEGQKLLAGWERIGGADHLAQMAVDAGADFMDGLPAETRHEFEGQFASLSTNLQVQMQAELTNSYVGRVPSASSEHIAAFAKSPEGKTLTSEWAAAAPRKVAMVRARTARLYGSLDADEIEELDYFLDHVSGPEWKYILSALSEAA